MRIITILLCLVASLAYGQQQVDEDRSVEQPCEGRTIERSTMLGIGSTEILDTYLSQEKYRGTEVRFVSHTISKRPQSRWSRLILLPLKASYEVGIPLMGFMFSPNYGQSYYEIFNRGNYDHNVVFTHPVNAPSLRQMLAIDATFGRTTLRIGYLGDIRQSKVNDIKAHTYTHAFVLGFTRKFSVHNL